jgi:hypothetical protein
LAFVFLMSGRRALGRALELTALSKTRSLKCVEAGSCKDNGEPGGLLFVQRQELIVQRPELIVQRPELKKSSNPRPSILPPAGPVVAAAQSAGSGGALLDHDPIKLNRIMV